MLGYEAVEVIEISLYMWVGVKVTCQSGYIINRVAAAACVKCVWRQYACVCVFCVCEHM